jgi:hypothetical protein
LNNQVTASNHWSAGHALGGLHPATARRVTYRTLARICDDPDDRLLSMPAGKDPHERMAELDDSGFIVFTRDDEPGLIRVYGLVWIG